MEEMKPIQLDKDTGAEEPLGTATGGKAKMPVAENVEREAEKETGRRAEAEAKKEAKRAEKEEKELAEEAAKNTRKAEKEKREAEKEKKQAEKEKKRAEKEKKRAEREDKKIEREAKKARREAKKAIKRARRLGVDPSELQPETLAEKWARFRKWMPFLLTLLILLLIAGGVFVTRDYIKDFSDRIVNIGHPEMYFRVVKERQLKDRAARIGNIYDSYVVPNLLGGGDRSASLTAKIKLNEKGQDKLAELSQIKGKDLSWLGDVSARTDFNETDKLISVASDVNLENRNIFTLSMIANPVENDVYYQMPQINSDFLGFEDGECSAQLDFGTIQEPVAEYLYVSKIRDYMEFSRRWGENKDLLKESLPSGETVEMLYLRYMELILSETDAIKKVGNEELEADGCSQKCTRYDITISTAQAKRIYKKIFETASEDKDLRDIYIRLAEVPGDGTDGYEQYSNFQKRLEEAAENAEEYVSFEEEAVISVYINRKGQIVGEKLMKDEGLVWEYRLPVQSKKQAFYYATCMESEKYSIEGSGEAMLGNFKGKYVIEKNHVPVISGQIKGLDLYKLNRQMLDLEATAYLLPEADEFCDTDRQRELTKCFKYLTVNFSCKTDKNSMRFKSTLKDGDEKTGTVEASFETKGGKKQNLPALKNVFFVEDTEDLNLWMDEAEWDKYIAFLEKSGGSDEWIKWLRDAVDKRE